MKNHYKLLLYCLLLCMSGALWTSCTKEYSYEGGPPAVFELAGAPGECLQSNFFGVYFEGVAANKSDSLQVSVHVSTAGHYNINSNPADGLQFSGSGKFSDTGNVLVTLACSGTPDSAGTFMVVIPGLTGCHTSLTVQKEPPSSYYLAGYPNNCQSPTVNGPYIAGQAFSSDNTVDIKVTVNSPGNYLIQTDTLDGMSFTASGYFSAAGNQVVTLKGTGKPFDPGLIFFTVFSDSSLCNFSIPVQNAEPLAVYVLESATGDTNDICTPHLVNGNYLTGTALNAGDSVTIGVYVKNVGNFSISTEMTNGMVFSYTGTFSATGEQTVTLYGSGKPASTGDFSFKPMIIGPAPLGGNSCNFDVIVN